MSTIFNPVMQKEMIAALLLGVIIVAGVGLYLFYPENVPGIDNGIELHYHKRQHIYSSSEIRARTAKLENLKDSVEDIPQHSPELIK